MALPILPIALGGLGALALSSALRKKKKSSQDAEAMKVGDVTGQPTEMRMGGKVKKMAMGGKVTRGDGACMKGHTKGRMV